MNDLEVLAHWFDLSKPISNDELHQAIFAKWLQAYADGLTTHEDEAQIEQVIIEFCRLIRRHNLSLTERASRVFACASRESTFRTREES